MPRLDEVDSPKYWRRCPACGEKKPGVRKDPKTNLTQCDRCWFATEPARHGHTEGK